MTEKTTELNELRATERGSAELAAAKAALNASSLMRAVENECPKMSKDLADALGVTRGRVSQILNGDGNVKIATLARVLDACGFELSFVAKPKGGEGRTIEFPREPRRRAPQVVASGCEYLHVAPVKPDLFMGRSAVVVVRKGGWSATSTHTSPAMPAGWKFGSS
jgi:transcriptional regulator with XRE-family HTH domain